MTSFSLSQLFSSSSLDGTTGYNTSQVVQVLTFRPSPNDHKVTLLQREGPQGDSTPLYASTTSKFTKPNIQIFRVVATSTGPQQTAIGSASFHLLSSTTDLSLHGQYIAMKSSSLSSSYNFMYPPTGKMKWKSNFMGTALELFDSAGLKLARYKFKFSSTSGKRLEILVPCADSFLDLIVLSGMAATVKEREKLKAVSGASEASGAVAGVVAGV